MINKYRILNELKERIESDKFIEVITEEKHGKSYYKVRFGNGISISMDRDSRLMYINFAFNHNEKDDLLELLKITTPMIKTVDEQPKQSFFKKLFSKK